MVNQASPKGRLFCCQLTAGQLETAVELGWMDKEKVAQISQAWVASYRLRRHYLDRVIEVGVEPLSAGDMHLGALLPPPLLFGLNVDHLAVGQGNDEVVVTWGGH